MCLLIIIIVILELKHVFTMQIQGDDPPNFVEDLVRRGNELIFTSPEKPEEFSATASETPDSGTKWVAFMGMNITENADLKIISKDYDNDSAHKKVIANNNNPVQVKSTSQESSVDPVNETERQNH